MKRGRAHAMYAGNIKSPTITLVDIRMISNTLISLWNSTGENTHGARPADDYGKSREHGGPGAPKRGRDGVL